MECKYYIELVSCMEYKNGANLGYRTLFGFIRGLIKYFGRVKSIKIFLQ